MKKKILMLLGWYYPDSVGGTENYVRMLTSELCKLGNEIIIAAPSKDENESNYEYEGIKVYRYPIEPNPSKDELSGKVEPRYFDYYKTIIEKVRPNIVHMHSLTRGCSVFHAEFIKKLGIPLVLTVHVPSVTCARGTLMLWGTEQCDGYVDIKRCTACMLNKSGVPKQLSNFLVDFTELMPGFIPGFNKLLNLKKYIKYRTHRIKELFNIVDHTVLVCEWLNEVLIKNSLCTKKVSVIRHGLNEVDRSHSLIDNNEKKEKIIVGYIGRFDHVKGLHVLVQAFNKLKQANNLELNIYGKVNSKESAGYLKKIESLANSEKIKFCGEMNEDNRCKTLNSLDVIAVPSIWMETGPLVVLEAFNAGIPVVGSDLGGISELIDDGVNGLLFKQGNVDELSKILVKISEYPEIIEQLKKRISPVNTISNLAESMENIYKSL